MLYNEKVRRLTKPLKNRKHLNMYDFKNLSPLDFESLIADLFCEEKKLQFEIFKPGKDSGIDLRAFISPDKKIIVQCKHYSGSKLSNLLTTIKNKEIKNLKKISPHKYYITTSLGLTPSNKDKIHEIIKDYALSPQCIYGREDINTLLRKYPHIEKKHIKLWLSSTAILNRILHSGTVNISQIELENIQKKIKFYVRNESYNTANKLLKENNFLIISGIPGIGKSTLAEILIYEHLEKKFELIKVSENISEAFKMLIPEKRQIFYYDDFLGQTNLSDKLGKNEDHRLITLIREIKESKNKKLILTTREYILQEALLTYEKLNDPLIEISKCIIDLSEYNKIAKAEILYNHLYFSKIPQDFKEELLKNNFYLEIINHANYNPRIIEWMVSSHNLELDKIIQQDYPKSFILHLENPEKIWSHAFEYQLSEAGRYLLITLYSLGSHSFLDQLKHVFTSSTDYNQKDFNTALKQLEGSFICLDKEKYYFENKNPIKIKFHNPSIRDFITNHISINPDYIDHLLDKGIYFSQLSVLWGAAFTETNQKILRNYILKNVKKFTASLSRLALFPYNKKYLYITPNKEVAFEKRAFILLDIFSKTNSKEIKDIFFMLINNLKENMINDPSILLSLIKEAKKLETLISTEEFMALINITKKFLKKEDAILNDCIYITELCENFRNYLSKDDIEEFKNLINSYAFNFDSHEYDDFTSKEDLLECMDELESLSEFWSISLYQLKNCIEEKIIDLEEKEENIDYDEEEGSNYGDISSESLDDSQIYQMFNTLKI